jgi:hypothetical protein
MKIATRSQARGALVIAFVIVAAASPAGASQDPGPLQSSSITLLTGTNCPLERVGTQFVRCDYLTGAGVPAAPWVPELNSTR